LVQYGSDINAKDKYGQTPIFYAVSSNKAEMVSQLINLGADLNIQDSKSLTPYKFAMRQKRKEIAGIIAKAANKEVKKEVKKENSAEKKNSVLETKRYVIQSFLNNKDGYTLILDELEKFFIDNVKLRDYIVNEAKKLSGKDSDTNAIKMIQDLIAFTEANEIYIGIRAYLYLLIVMIPYNHVE
jgi:hypothetical protein